MDAPWQLQPAPAKARAWLFALAVGLPMAIIAGALAFTANDMGPGRLIGGSEALTVVAIAGGTLALCLVIHGVIARALRRHHVTIDEGGLAVTTTFYSRRLGWDALDLAGARVVDLAEHTGLKPMLKTNGTSLPGFESGWFRLRNRDRALVATSGGSRVLHLPTTQGYGLLLQPRQPGALLQRLRELAPATRRR